MTEKSEPATNRQKWALFTGTGYDVRECTITKDEAGAFIERMKSCEDIREDIAKLQGAVRKNNVKPKKPDAYWQDLLEKARAVAVEAAAQADKGDATGFVMVNVKPANSQFAKFLMRQGIGARDETGGVAVRVNEFSDSYPQRVAYAGALVKALKEKDIRASRIALR